MHCESIIFFKKNVSQSSLEVFIFIKVIFVLFAMWYDHYFQKIVEFFNWLCQKIKKCSS